jgi:hypothetical protein
MKRFIPGIFLSLLPLTLTAFVWLNRDHLRPNGAEWVALALCGAIYVAGSILLLREVRRLRRPGNGHSRAMEARRQKHYESLPPGQL